ncbi:PspC domain-containing protein [Bariatricus massiliensis]
MANYFGVDPKIVRLLCFGLIVAYGSGLLLYILFVIFVPKEP